MTVVLSWTFLHTMFAVRVSARILHPDVGARGRGTRVSRARAARLLGLHVLLLCHRHCLCHGGCQRNVQGHGETTTLHCIVAFFFNTTILALTVNIGGRVLLKSQPGRRPVHEQRI